MKINFAFGNPRRSWRPRRHVDADLLSAYLDAQATADERRRVEAHLATCAACRNELAGLRHTVTLLHALPRIPVPRAFTLAEVQVGRGRPAAQPAWLGGMLRGLAAVSAVALVAVVTATLVTRPIGQPPLELARVAAPAVDVAPAAAREAAPQAAPALAAQPAAVELPAAPTAAVEKAATPAIAAHPAATAIQLPASAPAIAKAAAATPTRQAPQAPAAPPPAAAQPTVPPAPATPEKAVVALAAAPTVAPTAALAAAAAATAARSAAGAGVTAAESNAGPASAVRDAAGVAELPPEVMLAYAAGGNLWTIDRVMGARQATQANGVATPVVSGDRAWIAYRLPGKDGAEVWGVPWAGGEARLLLAERDLNKEAPAGSPAWRIQDVRWLPGKRTLAVTVVAAADGLNRRPDAAPALELWAVEVESGQRKLTLSSDVNFRPVVAPNGATVAFLRRDPDKPGEGGVWLTGMDGAGERAVLRFPLPADQPGAAAQIGWLPDSSGFWLALPQVGAKTLAMSQVLVTGDVRPAADLDARQVFWSPDGTRLTYTRPVNDPAGPQELYVANADGAQARLYATLARGRFVAWAADNARFLYEDGGQTFIGAPDAAAVRLAVNASEPRWAGAGHVIYVTQQGASRQLVYQAVGGRSVVLQTLPPNTPLDGLWP
jgi:hypothetical protein